jgi:hypothetical protein
MSVRKRKWTTRKGEVKEAAPAHSPTATTVNSLLLTDGRVFGEAHFPFKSWASSVASSTVRLDSSSPSLEKSTTVYLGKEVRQAVNLPHAALSFD